MTFKQKIVLSFASILTLMSAISVIGVERVGVMNANLEEVSTGAILKQRYAINFRGSVHDRAISIRDAVLVDNDTELNKHLSDVTKLAVFYADSAKPMQDLLSRADATDKEKELEKAINEIEKETLALTAKLIELRQKGEILAAQKMLLTQVADKYSAWLKAINNFIDYQEATIKGKVGTVESVASSFSTLMIAITLIAILLGVGFAVYLTRTTQRLLGADPDILRNYAQALAQGYFNTIYPKSIERGSVLAELQLAQSNSSQAIVQVNTVVSAIARGKFDQRIHGELSGDWLSLKSGVNEGVAQIQKVMTRLSDAMASLEKGAFNQRIDTQSPGDFGVMLVKTQAAMNSLHHIVDDINSVMSKLVKGDFSSRVSAPAQGDLDSIKSSVNASLNVLDGITCELLEMAKAQMNGDLTVISKGEYEGRFKELQQARRESTAKMIDVVNRVLEASYTVSDASSQVSHGAHDLSARVQEQAASLEQTTSTMNAMTSAVEANTQSATQVAKLAHQVEEQSKDGVKVMQETIGAMKSIQDSSNKIADIVSIIDSIAFQTNLLALNAAVEAARAGEHGRGFAVVASEVRALAGKSSDAAKDIKSLIEESVDRINTGTQLADKSGEMLAGISASVNEVTQMIETISQASKDQASGIMQVNQAMASIEKVTQENAALVEETTAAAQSLKTEAEQLQQNVSFFNTGKPVLVKSKPIQSKSAVQRLQTPVKTSKPATARLPAPSKDDWKEF